VETPASFEARAAPPPYPANRKQNQVKPDCGDEAKANSIIHREITVTAPVLDSTRHNTSLAVRTLWLKTYFDLIGLFVEYKFPCSRSVVCGPDMEFALFARARGSIFPISASDISTLATSGGSKIFSGRAAMAGDAGEHGTPV
jgi:hypothetical protein